MARFLYFTTEVKTKATLILGVIASLAAGGCGPGEEQDPFVGPSGKAAAATPALGDACTPGFPLQGVPFELFGRWTCDNAGVIGECAFGTFDCNQSGADGCEASQPCCGPNAARTGGVCQCDAGWSDCDLDMRNNFYPSNGCELFGSCT